MAMTDRVDSSGNAVLHFCVLSSLHCCNKPLLKRVTGATYNFSVLQYAQ